MASGPAVVWTGVAPENESPTAPTRRSDLVAHRPVVRRRSPAPGDGVPRPTVRFCPWRACTLERGTAQWRRECRPRKGEDPFVRTCMPVQDCSVGFDTPHTAIRNSRLERCRRRAQAAANAVRTPDRWIPTPGEGGARDVSAPRMNRAHRLPHSSGTRCTVKGYVGTPPPERQGTSVDVSTQADRGPALGSAGRWLEYPNHGVRTIGRAPTCRPIEDSIYRYSMYDPGGRRTSRRRFRRRRCAGRL